VAAEPLLTAVVERGRVRAATVVEPGRA